ncbi:MAG: DUF4245 domain-containing protein [Aeromicrobium erythreum]
MAGTSSRGNPAMGDVVRSVAVLGLIVLGIFLVGKLVTVTPDNPTSAVDYRDAARSATDAVSFPVLAPPALPEGWRATSARLDDGKVWALGVVTADDDFVGLHQGTDREDLLDRYGRGTARGDVTIDGDSWQERRGSKGETVLVRQVGGSTAIVTGTAPRATVLDFVASLDASR